ncbi:MAG TPA: hypothetical protein DCQ29_12705 [Chitinophagaceae bacterium]|nr:hypothetical protein [Chitinophagaceae bacterium]
MNFIKLLEQEKIKVVVFTSYPPKKFNLFRTNSCVKIVRIGTSNYDNRYLRLLNYFIFYAFATLKLFINRPKRILYFETNSFFPIYLYVRIGKIIGIKTKLFCHYHEFTSTNEYMNGMKLTKWLYFKELRCHKYICCISHTNTYRLNEFIQHTGFPIEQLFFQITLLLIGRCNHK